MYKRKRTSKVLYLLFVVLLTAFVINKISQSKKGETNFKSELMEFAAEDVVSLDLHTQANNFKPFSIVNNDGDWTIQDGDKEYPADSDMISNMIFELSALQAVQKVAAKKDRWSEFDVTDTTGVRVIVNSDKKVIGDIHIGRFSYNQNTRKPKTYVRLTKEKDVFAVEGYLSMTFNRDINGLRDKSVFRGNRNDISRISVSYPADSSFTLINDEASGWTINGEPVDSTYMSNYLESISYTVGTEFRDDVEIPVMTSAPYSLIIEGINMTSVEIRGLIDTDGSKLIYSNANGATVFNGDTGDLFNKIFIGPGMLKPKGILIQN